MSDVASQLWRSYLADSDCETTLYRAYVPVSDSDDNGWLH